MSEALHTIWTSTQILTFLNAHTDILRSMGVVNLGLFGSFARDEQTTASDLDFVVTMRDASYRSFMNVKNFLEDSFGMRVDLGDEHLVRPEIRDRIMKDVQYVAGLSPVSE